MRDVLDRIQNSITGTQMRSLENDLKVTVERLLDRGEPLSPFDSLETEDVLWTRDSCLPNEKIYVLRHDRRYLLRIAFQDVLDFPFVIAGVQLKPPDSPAVELRWETAVRSNGKREVVALLEPWNCKSAALRERSPMFGSLRERCPASHVIVNLQRDPAANEQQCCLVDIKRQVYCRMAGPDTFFLESLRPVARQKWESLPQFVKTCFIIVCLLGMGVGEAFICSKLGL